MKKGLIVILAMAFFGVLAAAVMMTPDDSAEREIKSLQQERQIYRTKEMYTEAAAADLKLIALLPNDYELLIEHMEYCRENGLTKQFLNACQKAIAMNPSDPKPACALLDYYVENNSRNIYELIRQERERLSEEDFEPFDRAYRQIRGSFRNLSGQYDSLSPWHGDYAFAGTSGDATRCYVLGKTGEVLFSGMDHTIDSYSTAEKLTATEHKGQRVYINAQGSRKRVPYDAENNRLLYYRYLGPFENGFANFCDEKGDWGYLNASMATGFVDYEYTSPFSCSVSAAKKNGKWGFLNTSFSSITDFIYSDVYLDEYGYAVSGNVAYVKTKENGDWIPLIFSETEGEKGQKLLTAATVPGVSFGEVKPFGDERGAVCDHGKWGLIGRDGQWTIEPAYEDAWSPECGLAPVKINGQWGYIDEEGAFSIEPQFENAYPFNKSGTAAVNHGDGWRLIQLYEYYYQE